MTRNDPWWLLGEQACAGCYQRYSYENEYRCAACDETHCFDCVVIVVESGEVLCHSCWSREPQAGI